MINEQLLTRRGPASEWSSVNPVLLIGEIGLETDTRKLKVGDGVTAWSNLAYWFEFEAPPTCYAQQTFTNSTSVTLQLPATCTGLPVIQIWDAANELVAVGPITYANNSVTVTFLDPQSGTIVAR